MPVSLGTQATVQPVLGENTHLLLEKTKAGMPMHGFTANYIRVEVENDPSLVNKMVDVLLGELNEDGTALKGTIL